MTDPKPLANLDIVSRVRVRVQKWRLTSINSTRVDRSDQDAGLLALHNLLAEKNHGQLCTSIQSCWVAVGLIAGSEGLELVAGWCQTVHF